MDIKNHQRTAHSPSTIKKIKSVKIGEKLSSKAIKFWLDISQTSPLTALPQL